MRSSRPKPLHLLCGRAMLRYVARLAGRLRRSIGSWSWSATAPSGSPKKLQSEEPDLLLEFVEQHVQRGTGDAASVGPHRLPRRRGRRRRGRRHRPAGRHAAAATVHRGRARRRAPRARRRLHACSAAAHRRPDGLRPDRPGQGRPGGSHRRAGRRHRRGAGDRRDQHLDLLLPSQRARTGAAPPQPRERPGRVLPDRRRRGAARRRLPGDRVDGRRPGRDPGRERPGAAGRRPKPSCAGGPTTTGSAGASRWSTRASTYVDATVRLAPDVTLFPGTILQGSTVVEERAEIGPDTRLVDCVVGERRRSSSSRPVAMPRSGGRPGRARIAVAAAGRRRWPPGTVTGPFYTASVPTTGPDRRKAGLRHDGAGHQEEAPASTPAAAIRRWPKTSPPTSVSELGEPNLRQFANGELHCRYGDSIRGADVFIIQTHGGPTVNDAIMEQLIMIDAAKRASAKRITAVCPFYGYARQDRKAEGREPITAKLVADMLTAAGAEPCRVGRPAHRPDPGLLRRAGRPSHRHAGAGRLPARRRAT